MKATAKVVPNPYGSILSAREARVVELRLDGKTFREIGAEFNLPMHRASQIHREAQCKIALNGLGGRARDSLMNSGFDTRDKILAGLARGEIAAKCKIRNFARKTYLEVCTWAGVTPRLGRRQCRLWATKPGWNFDPYSGKPLRPV